MSSDFVKMESHLMHFCLVSVMDFTLIFEHHLQIFFVLLKLNLVYIGSGKKLFPSVRAINIFGPGAAVECFHTWTKSVLRITKFYDKRQRTSRYHQSSQQIYSFRFGF